MASEVPPVLAEIILCGPEVVTVERALAAALDRSGFSADDITFLTDGDALDLLRAVYARWDQQVHRLESSSCGLSVDGLGLLVVSVPVLDVPVIVMALKSRLFDLSIESDDAEVDGFSAREVEMIVALIVRLESLL